MNKTTLKRLWILLIFIFICSMLFGINFYYKGKGNYASETWVREYLTAYNAYNDNLTELDIQVLTKNLSDQIDDKIDSIDFKAELSDEQLMNLLATVDEELQHAAFSASQEKISELSALIVKKIIQDNLYSKNEYSDEYYKKIENLNAQLAVLRSSVNNITDSEYSTLTTEQIRDIAAKSGLDEATINIWISELGNIIETNQKNNEDAISEMAAILNVNEGTLKEFIRQSKEAEDSIKYLTSKLKITEEHLTYVLSQVDTSQSRELTELYIKIKAAHNSMQNQIDENQAFLTKSIAYIQEQASDNEKATNESIAANREAVEKTIAENREAVDALISDTREETDRLIDENKKNTDAAISELSANVLFYEYDKATNTLKLYEKGDNDESDP